MDPTDLPDTRLASVMSQASKVGLAHLETIVKVHRASKGVAGVSYPQDLQNLLLTTSRTLGLITEHLKDETARPLSSAQYQPLETLEQDITICGEMCQQVRSSCPAKSTIEAMSQHERYTVWKEFRHTQEKSISRAIQPLLVYYKHMKFGDDCDSLNHIMEYESFVRDGDDATTEFGDARSISSEATLLGVQEEKGKLKEYGVSETETEVEEVEPKGCLFDLFRSLTTHKAKSETSDGTVSKPSKVSKLMKKLTPSKVRSSQAVRHEEKLAAVDVEIRKAAADGSLYNDHALLNNPLLSNAIQDPALIFSAITFGDIKFLKFLLERGAPVNGLKGICQPWRFSLTPLAETIKLGEHDMCEALVKAGACLSQAELEKSCIYALRMQGPIIYVESEDALNMAVSFGMVEFIRTLLNHGAARTMNLEAGEDNAFHRAATKGTMFLKPFLDHTYVSKYINHPGKKLNTALHNAIEANHFSAVKLLLAAGASLEARNLRLNTPLHWAIKHKRNDIARYLIDHGGAASLEAPRIRLETPLKYAICSSNEDIVAQLLAKGADPNALTCESKSPLHSAAAHESHSMVEALLDNGADINCRGTYGSTPLYLACQNGRIATVKALLERGADTTLGRRGFDSEVEQVPKSIARKNGNLEVVELLEAWEQGRELAISKDVDEEDHADDHTCGWEKWFERYVVRVYEREHGN